MVRARPQSSAQPKSLLAKAPAQSTSSSPDTALSRASSLPQGMQVNQKASTHLNFPANLPPKS
ncbi:hypothetical protein DMX04_01915 [Pseudomonas koreensis]|nr:hypothetical protein DMX04_01915 [Pseudomonas koreensis]